jgi:hypothetical protein
MSELFNELGIAGLVLLIGESGEDLHKQLTSITLPVKIISIYAQGSKHYAWIQTSAKIVKKKKETK